MWPPAAVTAAPVLHMGAALVRAALLGLHAAVLVPFLLFDILAMSRHEHLRGRNASALT